jgi:hypothetical protein
MANEYNRQGVVAWNRIGGDCVKGDRKISMSRRQSQRDRIAPTSLATDEKRCDQTRFDRERIRVWDWESTGAGARDEDASA